MVMEVESLFKKYSFTPGEYSVCSVFTDDQAKLIQTDICQLAEERLMLIYDPEHPQQFLQRDAELRGQIGILNYLLERSASTVEQYNQPTQPQ